MSQFWLDTVTPALVEFWPSVVAVILVAVAGSVAGDGRADPWRRIALAGVVAASVACLVHALRAAAVPVNNMLTRDVVTMVFIGAFAPTLSYVVTFMWRVRARWLRVSLALIAGLMLLLLSPLVLLAAHCSSGDCL